MYQQIRVGGKMENEIERRDYAPIIGISFISAIIAGFCCIAPVVLVLLGLSTASFAYAFNNTLETTYDMAFMIAGLAMLFLALSIYVNTKGKLKHSRIRSYINYFIIGLMFFVVSYLLLHDFAARVIGYKLGIWNSITYMP
jgi:hypothetical protein